jgi:surface protein
MSGMFNGDSSFNRTLIWNTTSVINMVDMFNGASSFNQLLTWDTAKVTNMAGTFAGALSFNQPLLWNTAKVLFMNRMFKGASLFNRPLAWNTASVIIMLDMFNGASSFNQLLTWDTSNVTDMSGMFNGASSFNQSLSWSTAKVTNMDNMFQNATVFVRDLSAWNVANTKVCGSFCDCCGVPLFTQCLPCANNLSATPNGNGVNVCKNCAPSVPSVGRELPHSGLDDGEIAAIVVPLVLLGAMCLFGFLAGVWRRKRAKPKNLKSDTTEMMPVA